MSAGSKFHSCGEETEKPLRPDRSFRYRGTRSWTWDDDRDGQEGRQCCSCGNGTTGTHPFVWIVYGSGRGSGEVLSPLLSVVRKLLNFWVKTVHFQNLFEVWKEEVDNLFLPFKALKFKTWTGIYPGFRSRGRGCWLNPRRVSSDLYPSPLQLGVWGSALSSPAGSGAETRPRTRALRVLKSRLYR